MKKNALVTGASKGIGYEFAQILAENGYDLIITARSEDKLNVLKKDLESRFGTNVLILPADLSLPETPDYLFNKINEKGLNVDVLINNAGFGYLGDFADSEWGVEEQMIKLNVLNLTCMTKLFLKGMKERKSGRIVNVASTAAFQPGPLMSVYYASKAYVLHFSEAIATELEGSGVTVTALCPGLTESEFAQTAGMENTTLAKYKKMASARDVVSYGYQMMLKGKKVAVVGAMDKLLIFLIRFSPRNLVSKVVRLIQDTR